MAYVDDPVTSYYGITHCVPSWLLPLWRKTLCKHNIHCFDEMWASKLNHYLVCDACDLEVSIRYIGTTYVPEDIKNAQKSK